MHVNCVFFIRTQLPPPPITHIPGTPSTHHHPFASSPFCSVTHNWASACVQRPCHVQTTAFHNVILCLLKSPPTSVTFPEPWREDAVEILWGQLLDNHLFPVLDQLWVFTLTRDHSLFGSRLRTALTAVYEHKPLDGSLTAYPFTKRRVILP